MSNIPDDFWDQPINNEPIQTTHKKANKPYHKLPNIAKIKKTEVISDENEQDIPRNDDVDSEPVGEIYVPSGDAGAILITKSGAFIKFDYLTPQTHTHLFVKRIANYFTLKHMVINGSFITRKRCIVDIKNKRIIVPRFGVYEILSQPQLYGLHNYTTNSLIMLGNDITFTWQGKQTHNQNIISDYIMNNIYTEQRRKLGSAGVVVNLEAGQGKSYLAAYLMSKINKKTALIIHTTALIDQWASVIRTCYPERTIGYYYGKKKIDGDIIIMVVKSAVSDEFKFSGKDAKSIQPLDFYNQFGFIIFDECHEYANNFAGRVFKHAQAPYMLGLSATPDEREDGFDTMVTWEIGPILNADELDGYRDIDTKFTATIHKVAYYGPLEYTRRLVNDITNWVDNTSTVNMVCEDPYRNSIIIDCIKKCLEKNMYVYVFADRRDYLEKLRELLTATMSTVQTDILENEADYVRLVGGASVESLESAEIKAKVIFATYRYIGTGRSIIKMNSLVFATPRKRKMRQYTGRIFRLGSDASIERQIYDVVDMKISLAKQWYDRKAYYESRGYTITETEIHHPDLMESVKKNNRKPKLK